MSGAPVVTLTDVRKSYGAQPVLRGVTLSIAPGELCAIVGRSGSGKSTLLHIIGGLDRRYSGLARVLDVDLGGLSDRELARFRGRRVGFVFQAFHLLDHLSCAENVALPSYFAAPGAALAPAEASKRAREALDRVGVGDKADELPSRLSGGQKQRVAIARALFHRPDLLLADEPTGNLDSETGEQIIDVFRQLHKDGLTLLVVTHEERVSRVAGRVIRLEDGRVVGEEGAPPPSGEPAGEARKEGPAA